MKRGIATLAVAVLFAGTAQAQDQGATGHATEGGWAPQVGYETMPPMMHQGQPGQMLPGMNTRQGVMGPGMPGGQPPAESAQAPDAPPQGMMQGMPRGMRPPGMGGGPGANPFADEAFRQCILDNLDKPKVNAAVDLMYMTCLGATEAAE